MTITGYQHDIGTRIDNIIIKKSLNILTRQKPI